MPRFYFHVHDGQSLLDTEGSPMLDARAARIAALRFAGEILKDDACRISSNGGFRIEVTDDASHSVLRLSFIVFGSSDA